jgi:hypothetical protein
VSSPPQRASAARPRRPPESASASASAKKVFSKVFSPFKRLFGKGSSRSGK